MEKYFAMGIAGALALNLVLSGLSKALEVIKDKTESKVDDEIYAKLAKVMAILQKVIDWGSANRSH